MKKYFSLSKPLLRENFKLYWYLPVLAFISYFLLCIFKLVTSSNNGVYGMERAYSYTTNMLENHNPGIIFMMVLVPIITSCIVMNYYHNPKKAFFFNAQPLSRSRLFNTQIFTGWLLMMIPLVLTAIILIVLRNATVIDVDIDGLPTYDATYAVGTGYIYSYKQIFVWLLTNVSTLTFFYGMCTLAGSLVGNTAMQILGSGVFSVTIPIFVAMVNNFLEEFVSGYTSLPDWINQVATYSNPLIGMVLTGEYINNKASVFYLLAGILLLALAKYAVYRAKLENVGDGMIFAKVEELASWICAVLFALPMGLLFAAIVPTRAFAILGIVVGAVIAFFVVKIITHRTIKVFNRNNFKSLAILMVIVIFLGLSLIFDVTGYANKTPDIDDIESIEADYMFSSFDDCNIQLEDKNLDTKKVLTDRESFEKVLELHNYIVDNKLYFASVDSVASEYYNGYSGLSLEDLKSGDVADYAEFTYHLKNGKTFSRAYHFIIDENTIEMATDITQMKEFRELSKFNQLAYGLKERELHLSMYCTVYDEQKCVGDTYLSFDIESNDIDKIFKACEKDLEGRDYKSATKMDITLNADLEKLVKGLLNDGEEITSTSANFTMYYQDSQNMVQYAYLNLDGSFGNLLDTLSSLGYLTHDRITESGGSVEMDRIYDGLYS